MAVGFGACCAESALLRSVNLVAESKLGWWEETRARFGETVIGLCVPPVVFYHD